MDGISKQTPTSIFVISGRYFDVMNPAAADVKAWDIAWALSQLNRFTGHTPIGWDVLSHTGLVYLLAMQETKGNLSNNDKLGLLLHDGSEAYLGDMSRPLKHAMPAYREAEERVTDAILARFGLRRDQINWELVRRYDNQALWIERTQLLAHFENDLRDGIYTLKQYDMPQLPKLVKAKPSQYISLLRECAINANTRELKELFEEPVALSGGALQAAEQAPQPQRPGTEALPHDFSRDQPVDIPEERASLTMAEVRAQSVQGKDIDNYRHNPGAMGSSGPSLDLYGVQ